MEEKALRVRAKDAYIRLVKEGFPLGPREFARVSGQVIGYHATYSQVRNWFKEDKWADSVDLTSFDTSEELMNTRILLDIARDVILNAKEDDTSRDLAQYGRMYLGLVRKLPQALWPIMEEEIISVRAALFALAEDRKKRAGPANLASLSNTWTDLQKFVLPNIEEEEAEAVVPVDSLILAWRERTSGS